MLILQILNLIQNCRTFGWLLDRSMQFVQKIVLDICNPLIFSSFSDVALLICRNPEHMRTSPYMGNSLFLIRENKDRHSARRYRLWFRSTEPPGKFHDENCTNRKKKIEAHVYKWKLHKAVISTTVNSWSRKHAWDFSLKALGAEVPTQLAHTMTSY